MSIRTPSSEPGVDQFATELIQLMQAGFKREVRVEVPFRQNAVSLRYRIYHLRKRIRQTGREDLIHLTRVQARIEPDPRINPEWSGTWVVVVSPPDSHLIPFINTALKDINLEDTPLDAPDLGIQVDTLPEGVGEPPKEVEKKS